MQNVTLNNGVEMPILGYGVYQIAPEACERCVAEAIEVGYRSIDTAAAYQNEREVGRAIRQSGVPREEFFVTTKLWIQDAGYDAALKAFRRSMDKLGLDYLDLYLIHQPFGNYYGAWRAMEEVYKEGRVRAIGVCNFYPDRLVDLVAHTEIAPAVDQIEAHPFFQRAGEQQFMEEKGVRLESWGPFAEGRMHLFENEILQAIGAKYQKSVAQVVLRWLTQRGMICIPKSVHKERMEENFAIFDFQLAPEDMEKIGALDTKHSVFFAHTDPTTAEWLTNLKFDL